jgi:SPRY domain-containing SOCS box protein 3
MIGIGTAQARLCSDNFSNLLGEDAHSWGLSHKGRLWHAGESRWYTRPFKERLHHPEDDDNDETTIAVLFDGREGTLTYYKNGVSLGVAFTGLQEVCGNLYPFVSSTAARTTMQLGPRRREFVSLQDRCRAVVLRHLSVKSDIHKLHLPRIVKTFLLEY